MRWIVAALALLLVLTGQALAEPLIGRAAVIDGDTIDIAGERVRFNGIDAPESNQICRDEAGADWRCGQDSAFALEGFLAQSRPTRCEFIERDRYGRFVGDCYRADGASVADWLVRNGWALDWPRYSGGAYADAQAEAKAQGYGVWQGEFVAPWDWRRGVRLVETQHSDPAIEQPSACHPSYQGACVPIASDVDCAGGSGNGPEYVVGPVYVVGPDEYRLDGDGDGIGCE